MLYLEDFNTLKGLIYIIRIKFLLIYMSYKNYKMGVEVLPMTKK